MTNYREILRLQSLGLNKSQIAQSVCCSRKTVIQVLNVAVEKGIRYPLLEDLSDRKLSELLFPNEHANPEYQMPDYEYVHKELQKNGVTLNLLWLEYCEKCREEGMLSEEWHPERNGNLKPEMVSCGSHKKVWWKCSEGHEWRAAVYSRAGTQETGCPVCVGVRKKPETLNVYLAQINN